LQSAFSCPTKQVRILHEMVKTTEVEKSPTDGYTQVKASHKLQDHYFTSAKKKVFKQSPV